MPFLLLLGCKSAEAPPAWTDPGSGVTWQPSPEGDVLPFRKAAAHCEGLKAGGHSD